MGATIGISRLTLITGAPVGATATTGDMGLMGRVGAPRGAIGLMVRVGATVGAARGAMGLMVKVGAAAGAVIGAMGLMVITGVMGLMAVGAVMGATDAAPGVKLLSLGMTGIAGTAAALVRGSGATGGMMILGLRGWMCPTAVVAALIVGPSLARVAGAAVSSGAGLTCATLVPTTFRGTTGAWAVMLSLGTMGVTRKVTAG